MLHDQKAVVVLFQDCHELKDGECTAHIQLCDFSVQPAENAGIVATDEEDFVALQLQVAVNGSGQGLHEAMRTLKVSGSRETVGRSSISMIRFGWLQGYEDEVRAWGESERIYIKKNYICLAHSACCFLLIQAFRSSSASKSDGIQAIRYIQ
jgi:hypothetical protein